MVDIKREEYLYIYIYKHIYKYIIRYLNENFRKQEKLRNNELRILFS